MDQDKIGNLIKQIREENNLTQKELADRLGVTHQAVSKWENGKNVPDIAVMKEICEKFDMNIDEILNGEKKIKSNKNKVLFLIIPFIVLILVSIIIIETLDKSDKDFVFKTISSRCSAFKITGSAAYNKDKTSIYISNIEFCGKEDKEEYQKINCTLYEKDGDIKNTISTCEEKNNTTLENYLKDININVDNYQATCKNIKDDTLLLEITATTKEKKDVKYVVPIKLNDNCK